VLVGREEAERADIRVCSTAEKSIATVEFAAHRALIYTRLSRDQGDQTDTRRSVRGGAARRRGRRVEPARAGSAAPGGGRRGNAKFQ
jgi:hypothetical protein